MTNPSRVGELRPSQLLYTFGIGSVVDLPNMSVMVLGLDDWDITKAIPITEERLLNAVREELGEPITHLRQAPIPPEADGIGNTVLEQHIGVPVIPFPQWMLCPHSKCRLLAPLRSELFTLKEDRFRPEKNRYIHSLCSSPTPPTVIPARFVVACKNGHLDDFPWVYFVHKGRTDCTGSIRLYEYGVSGTPSDIEIKCDKCSATRRMSDSFGDKQRSNMPQCRARHPHIRNFDESCNEQMRTMTLGASNSWFPIMRSALSIPTASSKLVQVVEKHWSIVEAVTNATELKVVLQTFRTVGQLPSELGSYSVDDIWNCIEKKRQGSNEESSGSLKEPEWKVFSKADPAENSSDFRINVVSAPVGYERFIEKVVLVEKLREVSALIGYTRVESPYDKEDTELVEVHRGPLSRGKVRWVPASEVRGEGIFIQFKEQAICDWLKVNPGLIEHERKTLEAHIGWRRARSITPADKNFPRLRYLLLHSFSHALMRQLSIECGYTAASIRERIYSKSGEEEGGPMAGVLIYTSAADSEGTLGGLINLGNPTSLGRHIEQSLERMQLCASDPLCSEHDPRQAPTTLHWAACHACLFSPETSCEKGNKYLDRTMLVSTVTSTDLSFFKR
jgi:hypothetical protein